MSEVKVYHKLDQRITQTFDGFSQEISLVMLQQGSCPEIKGTTEQLVPKSDYDKLKEKLLTFEGMTFSENQEITKLKQAVEKLVRMYGPVNHWKEDNARTYTIFAGDDESTDMGQGDFEQKTTGYHWSNSVDDSNVSGKLAREIAKELGIEV